MRLLLACEFSAMVREAFKARGHEAWSCDILPTEIPGNHFQCDIREVLYDDWDMIIAFPPCTDLAVSGAAHFKRKRESGQQQASIDFFMLFANHPCKLTCIENPVGIMSTVWRKPDQIINPYQFGDPVSKKTCLWLKGLPLLKETNVVEGSKYITAQSGRSYPEWCWNTGGGTGHKRSKFFPGIANGMAAQWSDLILDK